MYIRSDTMKPKIEFKFDDTRLSWLKLAPTPPCPGPMRQNVGPVRVKERFDNETQY